MPERQIDCGVLAESVTEPEIPCELEDLNSPTVRSRSKVVANPRERSRELNLQSVFGHCIVATLREQTFE